MPRAIDVEKSRPGARPVVSVFGKEPMGETRLPPEGRPTTDASETAPLEGHNASSSPESQAPAPAASAPDLPPIAAKADDLEAIKKAVDDAASLGGGLWLSYLFVLFYLAVAAGAVTHEDLFFERAVKLPFLNIELPLLGFFFLAPILFLLVHAYTLVHLVFLTDKAKRFDQVLYAQMGEPSGLSSEESTRRGMIRAGLRRQLPSNIFVQFLAGPTEVRRGIFGWTLRAIAWTTLVAAPILLLLLLQIQFLPFHNGVITWTHRIALLADLTLLWWLWRKILSGRRVWQGRQISRLWVALGLPLSVGVFLVSVSVVTFPGEWQEEILSSWLILPVMTEWAMPATEKDAKGNPRTASIRDWATNAKRVSLHDWLLNEEPDSVSRRRFPFSNTLVLPGLNVYEGLGIDDPDKARWRDFLFRARGRDLRGAIFDFATLPKVDFEGADLRHASLKLAELRSTSLKGARLEDAFLDVAALQGASLDNAQLENAFLRDAKLQGASLNGAELEGSTLFGAQLQGAALQNAKLQGATLAFAQLQGAWLFGAQLQGALLNAAQLEGATLDAANLEGASLDHANLQGASLQQTRLRATDLTMAFLWRTNRAARVPGAPAPTAPSNIRMPDAPDHWLPIWRDGQGNIHAWNQAVYQQLHDTIEGVPAGIARNQALESILRADCANTDTTLASCDVSLQPPPEAAAWQKALETARVDGEDYAEALARELKELACSGDPGAIHVLRGEGFRARLRATGAAAIGLIDALRACRSFAAMTDYDRGRLEYNEGQIKAALQVDQLSGTSGTSHSP
jgi:uncharacterized protein YjbI with pentapeptide repeats